MELYGGKIDDSDDFNKLRDLVRQVITADAFEADYCLTRYSIKNDPSKESVEALSFTTETSWQAFMEWVESLPEREPPTYLGLPPNAEKILLVEQARGIQESLRLVMSMLEEGEQLMGEINHA